jgi:hypothetical protein
VSGPPDSFAGLVISICSITEMFQEGKSNHKFRDTKGLLSQNVPPSDI